MRVALDTSVLVPAVVAAHSRHARTRVWMDAIVAGEIQGVASWHAMAELWAVLTRLPLAPPLSGERARLIVERLKKHLRLVSPGAAVYEQALERCAELGLRSGAVFDAMHLVTAELERADILLTFNRRHFERLARESGLPSLVEPPDPPAVTTPASGQTAP